MKTLLLFFSSLLLFFTAAHAQTQPNQGIILHEQPDMKSKIVGAIAPGNALIPIFSQNNWLKVADPSNGNVGWVANDSLRQQGLPVVHSYTQTVITPNSKMIQTNSIEPIDEKQVQELLRNWQSQQKNMQQAFNQLFNQSIANFNALLTSFNNGEEGSIANTSIIQPIILTPQTSPKATPTTATEPGKPTSDSGQLKQ